MEEIRKKAKTRKFSIERLIRSEETLLESILRYSLKHKASAVASNLLKKFKSYDKTLSAEFEKLISVEGMNSSAAILLKLVDYGNIQRSKSRETTKGTPTPMAPIRKDIKPAPSKKKESYVQEEVPFLQQHLEVSETTPEFLPEKKALEPLPPTESASRKVTMFSKAVLKEGITLLPFFPDTESVAEINEYLRKNLHFSAEQTRKRYASYVTNRIFYTGIADKPLRYFARKYQDRQELREVCFYRFCKAEPLVVDVINELILPSIGSGNLARANIRNYLTNRFGASSYVKDCSQAIVEAMVAGGIAKTDKKTLYFAFRDVLVPSFAFILHSEFPEPGLYPISIVETSATLKALLWNPERILSTLYELRNQSLINKVSEIDSVRQITLKWTLSELVENLTKTGATV